MNVEYDLVIDFARPSKSNTIMIAEGDSNSRKCRFVLLSNKQAFDMLDVATATVKGVKTDGSVIFGDGVIVKDEDGNNINEVTYTLPAAVSDTTGKTTMTITLASNSGQIITSFEFYVQTRNSLYSEDDYISDTDLNGFRDLLNRSMAALTKMEQMTQAEALPNPYPLNVYTNKDEYHYSGTEKVDIHLGDIAYLAEDPEIPLDPVDETAAGIAVAAASEAKASELAAASSATSANTSKAQVEGMAVDVAAQVTSATASALNAGRSAVVASECETSVKAIQTNINNTIDNKVTTITTQLAGAMIDDIITDAQGYRDQAVSSATSAANSATQAATAAASVGVSVSQIKNTGVHIADITVNGTRTELYAPAAESGATESKDVTYDHTDSGLEADNVQDAIDEVCENVASLSEQVEDIKLVTLVVNYNPEAVGTTLTAKQGDVEKVVPTNSTGVSDIGVMTAGTWTVSTTYAGKNYSVIFDVTYLGRYEGTLSTFGVAGWLEAAGISTEYANLDAVLADEKAVRILFTKHASVDYLCGWAEVMPEVGTTILNNDLCAKWINLRDYALDTLYANETCKELMDTADKYGYGEWVENNGTWQPKGNVPVMTDNTAPYGEVINNSYYGSYYPYKAFDGTITDIYDTWVSNSQTTNIWLGYKFVNPVLVKRFELTNRYSTSAGRNIKTFKIQASNDGTTYVDLGSFSNPSNDSAVKTVFELTNETYYLYYRLFALTSYGNGITDIGNLQFYGRELSVSVPKMAGNTDPWGEVVVSSSASGKDGYKAFDNDSSTSWATSATTSAGAYIGYKFGGLTNLKMIKHTPKYSATVTWKLQYTDDGTTWNDTQTTFTDNETQGTKYIDVSGSGHLGFRIISTSTSGTTGYDTDLQFYGLDYSEHSERHYIYDNGVEVETLTLNQTQGTITKNSDSIKLVKNASSGACTIISNALDFTPYNLLRVKIGSPLASSYSNMLGWLATNQTSAGVRLYIDNAKLPSGYYLDVSSVNVNDSVYIGDTDTYGFTLVVSELWLE